MTDDVVETINAILNGEDNFVLLLQRPQLERIRDEIVALRKLTDGNWVWQQITSTRAQALEEAATVCRLLGQGGNMETALACAAAIRVLKEKPPAD